jgi:AraC family ethanolamine operon transcriptional activator
MFSANRFESLEAMASSLRDWDVEFHPMAADTAPTDLMQARVGPVMISHLLTECRHAHLGASPANAYSFALLADGDQAVRWCGESLGTDRIPLFAPMEDFAASVRGRFSVYTLSVDPKWLAQTAAWEQLLAHHGRAGDLRKRLLQPDPSAISHLRAVVGTACRELGSLTSSAPGNASIASRIVSDISSALTTTIASSTKQSKNIAATARLRAVRRALAYVHDQPNRALTVDEISKTAQVSERTLQRAFLEHFGVTPKSYIQTFRLNGVRGELLGHAPSEIQVRDTAAKWGFWHMGEFSRVYRQLYGETPSQTLASPGLRTRKTAR